MKFTEGEHLSTRSVCNSACIFKAVILKRTAKTVTINVHGEEKRCKIHRDDAGEFIFPHGRYSMAATFHAGEKES